MNDAKCQNTENKKKELKKDRLTRERGFIEGKRTLSPLRFAAC